MIPMASTRCFSISGSSSSALAGRVIGAMMSGFAALSLETSVDRSAGRLRPGDDLDEVPRRARRLVGRLERSRLHLAEQVVGVQEDDALRRDSCVLEDLAHVLHGPLAEHRPGGEDAVDVLDLLLALLHGLGDVGRDRIGGRDVDDEGHAPLLGDRDHGVRIPGAESAHQHLGAGVDQPLRLLPRDLGLRLRVPEHEVELGAAERLDAAGLVDGLGRELGARAGTPARARRAARSPVWSTPTLIAGAWARRTAGNPSTAAPAPATNDRRPTPAFRFIPASPLAPLTGPAARAR